MQTSAQSCHGEDATVSRYRVVRKRMRTSAQSCQKEDANVSRQSCRKEDPNVSAHCLAGFSAQETGGTVQEYTIPLRAHAAERVAKV